MVFGTRVRTRSHRAPLPIGAESPLWARRGRHGRHLGPRGAHDCRFGALGVGTGVRPLPVQTLPLLPQALQVRSAPLEHALLGVGYQRAERPEDRTLGLPCTPGLLLALPFPEVPTSMVAEKVSPPCVVNATLAVHLVLRPKASQSGSEVTSPVVASPLKAGPSSRESRWPPEPRHQLQSSREPAVSSPRSMASRAWWQRGVSVVNLLPRADG